MNINSTNLRSYLYEIAYHCFVDEMCYCQHSDLIEEAVYSKHQEADATEVSVETRVLFRVALVAIQTNLTADQRCVILLCFLNEFSLKETAAILGKEVCNVKVIQYRAITALRTALG